MEDISKITHAHPRCVQSCVAYGEIVAHLLDGFSPFHSVASARATVTNPEVREALAVNPKRVVESIPTTGYVIDSLRAAAWAVQQNASLEETLIGLVNRGDDADTTGAIAGGLLGARDGIEAVPPRWLEVIEYGPVFAEAVPKIVRLGV